METTRYSDSEEETRRWGSLVGAALRGGEVLALLGDLGSGKTVFTRGVAIGLGIPDPRIISSPTYVIEQVYAARLEIRHFDAYRLGGPEELLDLGFHDRLDSGRVIVVEWADRVEAVLPPDCLQVALAPAFRQGCLDSRKIVFSGPREPWGAFLEGLPARIGP